MKLFSLAIFVLIACFTTANSQNVEQSLNTVKERLKEPIKWQGGLSVRMMSNIISGIDRRRDPFDYRIGLNMNMDVYTVKIPLFFSFSDGKSVYGYQLPSYNILGLSPTYKWATLHLGRRSMNFSKYTLSGHTFEGIGFELKPNNWYVAAMYGRLKRAVAEDLETRNNLDPSYKRTGWSVKGGYQSKDDEFLVTIFSAEDDASSIERPISANVRPQENVVISANGKKKLFGEWSISAEFARNVLTRDSEFDELIDEASDIPSGFGLITTNSSTSASNAFNGQLNYEPQFGKFFVKYEQIDPGYRSLGSLSFNNDIRSISTGAQTALFNNRLSLGLQAGIEENNLSGEEDNDRNRGLLILNATYQFSDRLQFNADISNYRTTNKTTITTIPIILVDSISLVQTNNSYNLGGSWMADADMEHLFFGQIGYSSFNNIENDEVLQSDENKNYFFTFGYTRTVTESKMNYGMNINYSSNEFGENQIITNFTPSLFFSKPLLEDQQLLFRSTLNYSILNQLDVNANVLNWTNSLSYNIKDHHRLNLNLILLNRSSRNEEMLPQFTEFTASLRYNLLINNKLFSSNK